MERNELRDFLVDGIGEESTQKYFHITAYNDEEWLINYRNESGDSKYSVSDDFAVAGGRYWFKVKYFIPEDSPEVYLCEVKAELNTIQSLVREYFDSKREWGQNDRR